MGFRIRVRPEASCSFQWFNSDELATIHLRNKQQILFSGVCECIRQHGELKEREIVLSPSDEKISRFKKRKVRNPRQKLLPSPALFFDHPFFKKRVQLEVSDISTSGLSVHEKANVGVLMPGMIIPDLTINFAGLKVKCAAQVIYCMEEGRKGTNCGIAILDMDISAYSRLTNILANAIDPRAYLSNKIDMDDLWEFFFETDFIYPRKYRLVHSRREEFKKTFRKLYQEAPEIAKHFTYQENGRIYAHVSMVRAYEKAWMVQHHAGRTIDSKLAGLIVLKQIMHYLNDMFRLPSAKTDYVMICFRPDNKFPNLAFGGFARALNNPKGCSMDLFSYLPYPTLSLGTRLPKGWLLQECSNQGFWELNRFYNHRSGGLLLEIMQLTHKNSSHESVEKLYDEFGFLRRWKAYSLTHYDELNAVLIVEHSDLGLNLSELLNGIKIIVTDVEGLPWNILSTAIGQLAPLYNTDKVPVLIYPLEYVNAEAIPYEKQYQLWAYHACFMDQLMKFLQQKLRIHYWE
jgi:hypothetical protein